MHDFGPVSDAAERFLDSKTKRYASVERILQQGHSDVKRRGTVKASGITLLPSESFAKIITELVCCSKDITKKVKLDASLECLKVVSSVVACTQDVAGGEVEEVACKFAKCLTPADWKTINSVRRIVSMNYFGMHMHT
jgi:hypothetical protein